MRIAAFVPGPEFLTSAGVRIRYDRLRPKLAAMGHNFDVRLIDEARADALPDIDVGLVTKIHDGRAVALAKLLRERGARVGLDIFDDYFSQIHDSRLTQLRGWMAQISGHVDFALCATPPMQARLARLLPEGVPIHLLNDPHDALDPEAVAVSLEASAARARRDGIIDIAWFGMGDNPNFQVGLDDLDAFGARLSGFARRGWTARMRVLSNPRAMTIERIEGMSRLPIPWEMEEWSEDRQAGLLQDALLSFLPVNGQAFSTVKSTNRVLSALLGGTQVLSMGYPLYSAMSPLIYRDMATFLDDLEADRLRLRRETLPELTDLLSRGGDPDVEALRLAAFLETVAARAGPAREPRVLVLHGRGTSTNIHASVHNLGGLSVGHPFLPPLKASFDLALHPAGSGRLVAHLSTRALGLLRPELRDHATPVEGVHPQWQIVLPGTLAGVRTCPSTGPIGTAAVYERGVALVRKVAAYLFDEVEIVLSEKAAPFGAVSTCLTEGSPDTAQAPA